MRQRSEISRFGLLLTALLAVAAEMPAAEPVWQEVVVPEDWKKTPTGEQGRLWYRAKFTAPAAWRGRGLKLVVESIDDAREIYVGGALVGRLGVFPPQFRSALGETQSYTIPADAIQFGGDNVLAIRVHSIDGRSGFNVAAPVLLAGDDALRLAGKWERASGDDPAWARALPTAIKSPAFAEIESAAVIERELKKLQNDDGPLTSADSLARMKTPNDLAVGLVLAEPHIGQPLSIKFDSRGRLWVVNYLQYPNPAGLKMVSRDKHLRSVYDQIPPAPPNHFRGADKITFHEDTDGDGQYDKHGTFLEGLSLVSSFEFGRGGVWVLNPPNLLFYPDANRDDVPDGDPIVHLEGFGIEDSHSVTNSLRFGPDGWLYSTQGSTVTGNVKRPGDKTSIHSEGQLVWRYHPEQKQYEIFAEGGGNAFGLEFDAKGRVYSGHNGGNTRGFHYVQGGYYQKSFGKHGNLSNPFAFGYFEAMGHHNVPRFTHTFVINEGGALPEKYSGLLFGVQPLASHVVMSEVLPDRSSFKTKDVGLALETTDPWFRPVDIQHGPDGALYIADFYEQRIDHASHYQGRVHKESGRIYRLSHRIGVPPVPETRSVSEGRLFDFTKETATQLVAHLSSANKWQRQAARRELLIRGADSIPSTPFSSPSPQSELELVWAQHADAPLTAEQQLHLLDNNDPDIRLWTIRLACDGGQLSKQLAARLIDLAYREPSAHVRSQLAASARRLPAAQALPIVKKLAERSEDVDDIHIPLLLWWAIEAQADKDRDAVLALLGDKTFWNQPIVSKHLAERLMRRYAATSQRKDLLTCAQLLERAPSREHASRLMAGFEAAYEGRTIANLPIELAAAMAKAGAASPTVRLRQGEAAAVAESLALIADDNADAAKRQQLVAIFATLNQPGCVPVLLQVVAESRNDALRAAALGALQSYNHPSILPGVLAAYGNLSEQIRDVAQSLLASREAWAQAFVEAIEAGQVDPQTVTEPTIRKLRLHASPRLAALCQKHFGELAGASPEEVRAAIEKYLAVLSAAPGNPYQGKQVYAQHCGKCHVLFSQGGQIGPDLTTYKRDDLRGILLNVVHPSAEIREGFENYVVRTADGRVLTGFIADQDTNVVVIRGADGQNISLARDDIEDLRASPTSLMPAGQLQTFSDQQVRDLFAYLRSTQPLADRN